MNQFKKNWLWVQAAMLLMIFAAFYDKWTMVGAWFAFTATSGYNVWVKK